MRTAIVSTGELPEAAYELMVRAFPEDAPGEARALWASCPDSVHALVHEGDWLVGHAGFVERTLYAGGRAILTAYVEYVCAEPRRSGYGTAAMRLLADEIERCGYQLAGLATGSPEFYERLGWGLWRGPAAYRKPDGEAVSTGDEKPMVLDLGAGVDLDAPIECEWRAVGDMW